MSVRLIFAALAAAVVSCGPALADDGDKTAGAGTLSLSIENDLFGGTDSNYTHGTRIEWLSAPRPELPWFARVLQHIPLLDPAGDKRIGYALGQNIYTPDRISLDPPSTDERPYAGWLYVGLGLSSATQTTLDTIELDLGIVGPWSLAGDVQKTWHRWFDLQRPRGWEHQIDNEPGIMLIYEHKRRFDLLADRDFKIQLMPSIGGALGNVMTYASASAQIRFGFDLPDDFGPARIWPSLPGSAFFEPSDGFGWYIFGGVGGRLVAHNIFLDGNTFGDSPSVERELLVGDLQAGVALIFRPFRLTYTHVFRTSEFKQQHGGDSFGSLNLAVRF